MLTKDDSIKQKKKCLNMTCIHKLCTVDSYTVSDICVW